MKNLIILFITCFALGGLFSSCEEMFGDYLDKAPGVDVDEDVLFSSADQVEKLMNGMYSYGTFNDMGENDVRISGSSSHNTLTDCATNAGKAVAAWFWTNTWNSGGINSASYRDNFFNTRWWTIRRANIIIERIDEVPAEQSFKDRVKGEALVIRAYNNFIHFKFYGGIPIVTKRLSVGDEVYIQRSTLKETVDAIIKDCDEAIPLLPDVYPTNLYGKATKGAALALKARTLLYAASPIFNTATPYLELPGHNDLICYGNYDVNRWQLAADAAKAVMNWAPNGGISLITDKGVDQNYRAIWEQAGNTENIWVRNTQATMAVTKGAFWFHLPSVIYNGLSGVTVPLNFIKQYRKVDGSDQTWDMAGGNDLNQKYAQLESRFHQTFAYNGSYWNVDHPIIELWEADPANGIAAGKHSSSCWYGVWARKPVPAALRSSAAQWPIDPIFRLGEIYLYYAEALNEAQGPVADVYTYLNAIRTRSGLPALTGPHTKDEMREEIRREFNIEMIYENHYFWNLRRWLTADREGVMKGAMWGIKIYMIPGTNPRQFRYVPYVYETRSYNPWFNLNPWPQGEVNKGYLIQNPGY
ncbi:MAG: RagB/SusD family nutrient uptake outer membrane protein [Mangrovibacterium sp.]